MEMGEVGLVLRHRTACQLTSFPLDLFVREEEDRYRSEELVCSRTCALAMAGTSHNLSLQHYLGDVRSQQLKVMPLGT
jgi:hypothetical protein